MTDIEKYNAIVSNPNRIQIRLFDKNRYAGCGEHLGFLEGSTMNVAAFIMQTDTPCVLADSQGRAMIVTRNRFFKMAKDYESSSYGNELYHNLRPLTWEKKWTVDIMDTPIMLSFERYHEIYGVAQQLMFKPFTEVPEDLFSQAKNLDFYKIKGLPDENDQIFTVDGLFQERDLKV